MQPARIFLIINLLCVISLTQSLKAHWIQTGGPLGGQVYALEVNGTDVFVGIAGSVYVSTNNGTFWSQPDTSLPQIGTPRVFGSIGTNTFVAAGSNVFRSTNRGAQWEPASAGLPAALVSALCDSGTNLFAATWDSGAFVSSDSGRNWRRIDTSLSGVRVNSLAFKGTILFAGTSRGVYRFGTGWVNTGLTDTVVNAIAVRGLDIYVGTNRGVFVSGNDGVNWQPIGPSNTTIFSLLDGGTFLYAGTSGGVYRYAGSWEQRNVGLRYLLTLALTANSTYLFAGTTCGVFRSSNGGSNWVEVNDDMRNFVVRAIATKDTLIFSGSPIGVFISTNSGAFWWPPSGLIPLDVRALAVRGSSIFAGSGNGGVSRSDDNGANWNLKNIGLLNRFVSCFLIVRDSIFAGTRGGVFRSTNNGEGWTSHGLAGTDVRSLLATDTFLFAGTTRGIFRTRGLRDTNWTFMGLAGDTVSALARIDPYVFAGTGRLGGSGHGVFRSTNNGASWDTVNNGLRSPNVHALVANGTTLFAGTGWGKVFLTHDRGNSWREVNERFVRSYVNSLAVSGSYLLAGTEGSSVWRRPLIELPVDETYSENLPSRLALSQNYPNPFNPVTVINYQLPIGNSQFVSLKVYNILGQEVKTLVNESQLSGNYAVLWDGKNNHGAQVSTGIYFYRLEVNGVGAGKERFTEVKKMVMIR